MYMSWSPTANIWRFNIHENLVPLIQIEKNSTIVINHTDIFSYISLQVLVRCDYGHYDPFSINRFEYAGYIRWDICPWPFRLLIWYPLPTKWSNWYIRPTFESPRNRIGRLFNVVIHQDRRWRKLFNPNHRYKFWFGLVC